MAQSSWQNLEKYFHLKTSKSYKKMLWVANICIHTHRYIYIYIYTYLHFHINIKHIFICGNRYIYMYTFIYIYTHIHFPPFFPMFFFCQKVAPTSAPGRSEGDLSWIRIRMGIRGVVRPSGPGVVLYGQAVEPARGG